MDVELSLRALDDLSEILEFVGSYNPRAASDLVDGIERTGAECRNHARRSQAGSAGVLAR